MKRIFGIGLIFVMSLCLAAGNIEAAPGTQNAAPKKGATSQERAMIPKEIKAALQEGLDVQQGRQDIPFEIFRHLIFPARENLHTVFFFKVKNGDLGLTPSAQSLEEAGNVESRLLVFMQFYQADTSGSMKVFRELNAPMLAQETVGFDPEQTHWYSTAYAFPAGKFKLAMALASADLKRIGVGYYDFELPGPESYRENLVTTPIFFVKSMEQMQSPEMRVTVHKEMFTYSVLQIIPNFEGIVTPGENIEVFYYIFGAKQADPSQPNIKIEATYEVLKEDSSAAIKWESQAYDFPLVSQLLPLKQTVMIKDDKGERTEQRDLAAGMYSLKITIKDTISGSTAEKSIPLEVK